MRDNLDLDAEQQPAPSQPRLVMDIATAAKARQEEAPSYGPQADVIGTREVHLSDYVKVLYKRRWTAITAFLLIAGSVTIYTFTATPIYEAKSRLLIESDERNVVSFKQVIEEDQTKQDYYQTQYNILQSRALARKTVEDLQLWGAGPFAPDAPQPFSLARAVLGAPAAFVRLFRSSDGKTKENLIPAVDESAAQSRTIDKFLAGLTITPIRNSRLVDMKYRLPDPAMATTIVNALARNYIAQNLEYKFMASKDASDWLSARLGEQRKAVEGAEVALQRYREQNDSIALEDRQNIVVQKLVDLNAAVTRAKTERIQKESMYNQLRDSQNNPASLDTFPAILTNSFIQQQKGELAALQQQHGQLSEKLADKHPDIIKLNSSIQNSQLKLNTEIAKVVQSVKSEYQAALAQEQSLNSALSQQKGEAQSMNRKAIDYGVLDRDVQSNKQMYDSLMQRSKETGVTGELKTSNIRVVDVAEQPRTPVSPQKQLNMLLGLFGGALLACGLVFFFEYLDSRIRTPEEIRTHLGIAYMGLLPSLDPKSTLGVYPMINTGVPAHFSEAFRGIRTNVLFSSAQEGSRSLVVTSTGPGEGKSMVAANLSISLAQAGQRVMLIDADLRKPKVHEIFGVPQENGLSNVLVGNSKASESVRKTAVEGLWILPAGRIPPNPAELVGSKRFTDFLASLSTHFDWVIIDSPPVMAVTDAALLAHVTHGVLFVVGAEMTSRHAAKRAVENLAQVQARILGAVLNRVDLERNSYYYSQYYRREYTQYYAKTS